MTEKIKISKPVIVEGKYDKIKLEAVIDACIIKTDGFNVFKNDEKRALIRKLAENDGIIVITDSDGAGLMIRNFINSILPKDKIYHLYIPEIIGKEKRKSAPSKSGLLGVEGIEINRLRDIFTPFASDIPIRSSARPITKRDFYEHRLSGGENSSYNRKKLTEKLGFPSNMSANALLDALNMLYTYDEYVKLVEEILY